jgi:hypothetical protein
VAAPVVIYFALGDGSTKLLSELKDWMGAHNAAIMAVLLLVLGAKLIGDGLSVSDRLAMDRHTSSIETMSESPDMGEARHRPCCERGPMARAAIILAIVLMRPAGSAVARS